MTQRKSRQPARKGLVFYADSHRYRLDGKPIPSVTGLLDVLNKPGLVRWSAREVATYVTDHPEAIDALRDLGRQGMIDALRNVPFQKRDKAAERGTAFHEYAERILLGEEVEVPEQHTGMVEAALDFMDDLSVEPVLTEFRCASREHWHAGTGDLIADITTPTGDHLRAVLDWKSGKRIYSACAFQCAGYAFSEFYVDGEGAERPMADLGVEASFGIHVADDGYSCHPLKFGRDVYEEFTLIRRVHAVNHRAEGDWQRPGSGYVGVAL